MRIDEPNGPLDLKMWKSKWCSYKYLKFHFKILFFNVKANETIDKKLHRVHNLTSHTNYQASRLLSGKDRRKLRNQIKEDRVKAFSLIIGEFYPII